MQMNALARVYGAVDLCDLVSVVIDRAKADRGMPTSHRGITAARKPFPWEQSEKARN